MGAGSGNCLVGRKDGSEFPVENWFESDSDANMGLLFWANVCRYLSAPGGGKRGTRRSREQVELLSRVSLLGEMTALSSRTNYKPNRWERL